MKVSISWIKQLVDLKVPIEEVINLLPLHTIGTKEITDNFFELDMKGYNRADLLSLRGVAYEIAAITGSEVKFSEPEDNEYIWYSKDLPRSNRGLPENKVEIIDQKLCSIYCLAKIRNLKVGPSPADWVKKLADSGLRSVNNVADITNLVMLEYGQPLHAFDASQITDETLVVRTAENGEELVTLDQKSRKLETSDLVIADPKKVVALAGVMGGKNSEVSENTTEILLEAAIFDPATVRHTASKFGLPSEASRRFQHGLTKKRLLQAFDAAIKMYQELGGKLEAISIVGNFDEKEVEIGLTQDEIDSLIGIDIKPDFIKSSLEKLNFKVASQGDALRGWQVVPPYFRLDVNIEADVIEEIARLYGYENIPPKELSGELPQKIDQSLFELIDNLKTNLVKAGLTEIETYSFYSTQVLNNLNIDQEKLVKLANPISAETEYLRNKLWPNLLQKTAENLRNGVDEVAIFELGKVYQLVDHVIPNEEYRLALALTGDQAIQELSTILKKVLPEVEIKQEENKEELFHPVRFAKIFSKGKGEAIGFLAEVHPRITHKFGVEKRVTVLEIILQ